MKSIGVELAKEFIRNLGLDKEGVEVSVYELSKDFSKGYQHTYSGHGNFEFRVIIPLNIDLLTTSHPEVRAFQKIQESILSSPLVYRESKSKDDKISELEKEVERLKKYETHYELEYTLRQGKELITLQESKNERV